MPGKCPNLTRNKLLAAPKSSAPMLAAEIAADTARGINSAKNIGI